MQLDLLLGEGISIVLPLFSFLCDMSKPPLEHLTVAGTVCVCITFLGYMGALGILHH